MQAATALTLTSPLQSIPRIGPRRAAALATIGLTNVGRLLAHLPARHERLQAESTVEEFVPGQIVSARGEVTHTRVFLRRPKPRFEAIMLDNTARLDLVWFNQTYLRERIHPGMIIRVQGKAQRRGPGLQLVNPTWQEVSAGHELPSQEERLRPVYPATEAVPSRIIEGAIPEVL